MGASRSFFQWTTGLHLQVTGEDAADFLQSQFTNDLRPFQVGQCTYGLWLDFRGRVLGDSWILCEGKECFRILSERSDGKRIRIHLEKHIVADDVEIEPCEPVRVFELSQAVLHYLGLDRPVPGTFMQTDFGVLYPARADLYYTVMFHSTGLVGFKQKLGEAGCTELNPDSHGLVRMRAGIPLVPDEIGEGDLPGEGELEREALSFDKGCYLGQEIVARMHNIGRPRRRLFIVEGEGSIPELPFPLHNSESKKVGELRTAYSDTKNWCGVAILKTRFARIGERMENQAIQVKILRPLREDTLQ